MADAEETPAETPAEGEQPPAEAAAAGEEGGEKPAEENANEGAQEGAGDNEAAKDGGEAEEKKDTEKPTDGEGEEKKDEEKKKEEEEEQGCCCNPCDEAKCAAHEICIVDRRGPCLASTTRDGNNIECPQHQCVSLRENCSFAHVEKMCGEDHNIYMTTCSMFNRGVALAYYGPCREECLKDDAMMCGADGVTFKSICHAFSSQQLRRLPGTV
ncbi:hypothetical protein OS493_019986 [Desmophyllum pertusum]|uniref:Kazal-like domain-containing protein n=1 Tax=Desmophyllum pertusum TaxID=174260 RepID=A0A9W9YBA6_9CNID|nr:hypothetical protein OS493_019986 [Desmophyllum pertusum]